MTRQALVEAARGDRMLDLVIRGGQMVNVYTGEIARADIGIYGERIAVVDFGGAFGLTAREELDARGLLAVPGFVDTHVHIESTMVTPPNFARGVLPFGTTTVVIDPHEIGNVTGRAASSICCAPARGCRCASLSRCHPPSRRCRVSRRRARHSMPETWRKCSYGRASSVWRN